MRAIPDRRDDVIILATRALGGLEKRGAAIGILQNTAARLAADLHAFTGPPGAAAMESGKQGEVATLRGVLREARIQRDAVIADARKFCGNVIDLLKLHLGRVWNAQWDGAGFTNRSLAVPKREPLPLLLNLRNYLRVHPERENAPLGITAAAADTLAATLQTALDGVCKARSRRIASSTDCDAALRRLRKRLTALRCELDLLLDRDDERWKEFGFSAPSDRRRPDPVKGVTVEDSLPGQIVLRWQRSPRATNYRVKWTPQAGDDQTPRELGLFADPAAHLRDLPPGVNIRIEVTARNERGETKATRLDLELAAQT